MTPNLPIALYIYVAEIYTAGRYGALRGCGIAVGCWTAEHCTGIAIRLWWMKMHLHPTAINHLLSWGFVQCGKNQQGYFTKIELMESALPKIYHFLNRTPKTELWAMQKNLLGKYVIQPETLTGRFCVAMLERIEQRKDIEYGLAKDLGLLEDVLSALENIERLVEETYIRNFSEMVFHDSKRLQSILNPVTRILLDFGDGVGQKETVLAQYNLIRNPG